MARPNTVTESRQGVPVCGSTLELLNVVVETPLALLVCTFEMTLIDESPIR